MKILNYELKDIEREVNRMDFLYGQYNGREQFPSGVDINEQIMIYK